MKKSIIILIACLFAVQTYGQTESSKAKPRFGIKAGPNLAHELVWGEGERTRIRLTAHFGFLLETPIGHMTSFQPELLYSMQGARYKEGRTKYVDKMGYINMPLMFKFYFSEKSKFSFDMGPQIGYMVNAKLKTVYESVKENENIYGSIDNKYDISACLGLTFRASNTIRIVYRENLGIIKIMKDYPHRNFVSNLSVEAAF